MDATKLAAHRLATQRTADKYIACDGSEPESSASAQALYGLNVDDLLQLSAFLAWHEGHELMGGVTAAEAWHAMCRLLRLTEQQAEAIHKAIRGE